MKREFKSNWDAFKQGLKKGYEDVGDIGFYVAVFFLFAIILKWIVE